MNGKSRYHTKYLLGHAVMAQQGKVQISGYLYAGETPFRK